MVKANQSFEQPIPNVPYAYGHDFLGYKLLFTVLILNKNYQYFRYKIYVYIFAQNFSSKGDKVVNSQGYLTLLISWNTTNVCNLFCCLLGYDAFWKRRYIAFEKGVITILKGVTML